MQVIAPGRDNAVEIEEHTRPAYQFGRPAEDYTPAALCSHLS